MEFENLAQPTLVCLITI